MTKKDLISFRPAQHTDMPFIYRSILMGTYFGNKPPKSSKLDPKSPIDFFSSIHQNVFMESYHKHLENLFNKPGINIAVTCLKADPDVILGFSVFGKGVLYWVFVKPDWRGIGLGNDLIPQEDITTVAGFTRVGDIIRRKRNWVFNPWS